MKQKIVVCRQHDSMLCGVACLKMICKHYGKEFSIYYLSKICNATSVGVSLLSIGEAVSTLGFTYTCGKASFQKIKVITSACTLHWNQNHFVVLYKVKKGKTFYIADPAKGLVK